MKYFDTQVVIDYTYIPVGRYCRNVKRFVLKLRHFFTARVILLYYALSSEPFRMYKGDTLKVARRHISLLDIILLRLRGITVILK